MSVICKVKVLILVRCFFVVVVVCFFSSFLGGFLRGGG